MKATHSAPTDPGLQNRNFPHLTGESAKRAAARLDRERILSERDVQLPDREKAIAACGSSPVANAMRERAPRRGKVSRVRNDAEQQRSTPAVGQRDDVQASDRAQQRESERRESQARDRAQQRDQDRRQSRGRDGNGSGMRERAQQRGEARRRR